MKGFWHEFVGFCHSDYNALLKVSKYNQMQYQMFYFN